MESKKLERGAVDRKSIVMAEWRKSEDGRAFTGKQEDTVDKIPQLDPDTNKLIRNYNKVKVAVKLKTVGSTNHADNPCPFLGEFDLQAPLTEFIEELCKHWALENPDQYALQYDPSAQYVTEKNRDKVKDGLVLNFVFSAPHMAKRIMVRLEGSLGEKKSALEDFIGLAPDTTFRSEVDGSKLMDLLAKCLKKDSSDPTMLSYILTAHLKGVIHGILSWEQFEPAFIEKVASYVSQQASTDSSILSAALALLKHIALHSQAWCELVEKQITFPKLQHYFQRPELQAPVVGVIISFIKMSDPQRQKYWMDTLFSPKGRRFILDSVFRTPGERKLNEDLAHELYILQHIMLNRLEERLNRPAAADDPDTMKKIKDLRQLATCSSNEVSFQRYPRHQNISPEMLKLGFQDEDNPVNDLTETPPGMLPLDNMVHFANHKTHTYVRLIRDYSLRTDSHVCPFGIASIRLTKLLCEMLQIGQAPSENGTSFHPVLFSHGRPMEELFCVCIKLLYKTWKEMKATQDDLSQVLQVVQEQINQVLAKTPITFEVFRTVVNKIPYREIKEIWRQGRKERETSELKARPVKELRKQLEPEILDLIQEHRLRYLCEGTWFRVLKGMGAKNKVRHIRLSPNHKFLHYSDFEEESKLLLMEDLKEKIVVKKIKMVVTGMECPHVKEKIIKKSASNLAFSIILDESSHFDFVCPDEITCNYWVDGINALLGRPMTSPALAKDLNTLANMEVRLRLLDAEGITIPSEQPPIPPPPPNFDFCFEKSSGVMRRVNMKTDLEAELK